MAVSRIATASVFLLFLVSGRDLSCHAQRPVAGLSLASPLIAPATSVVALLEQMTVSAGVIFAGQVIAVRQPAGFAGSGEDAAEGYVEVDFRVDEAVRGCKQGSIFRLREWAGLWTGNVQRYRAGQRFLLFLHSAGAEGFTSPVHGPEGALPLRGGGVAPGQYDTSSDAAQWLVDLRWLQTQTLRKKAWLGVANQGPVRRRARYSPGSGTEADLQGSDSSLSVNPEPQAAVYMPWNAAPVSADPETEPLVTLLNQCRGWMRSSDGSL